MMRKAAVILPVIILMSALPAAQNPPGAPSAVVINGVENMHSRGQETSDVVSQALLGTNVRILKKQRNSDGEDWVEVETPDTYRGWITAASLRLLKAGDKPYASGGKIFVVSSLLANIYREADVTKHKPVKVAPISSVLELARESGERWCEILLPCGTRAWIQKGDGEIRDAPLTWPRLPPQELVALAKRFLGLPYLWGGGSPLGLDCSGFAQLLYRMAGVPILRDADIQFEKSGLDEVPAGQESAGDLVFFGRARDSIGHVGMMISAEEFIHATTWMKPVVQISRLGDAHWREIYQGARRPAGNI